MEFLESHPYKSPEEVPKEKTIDRSALLYKIPSDERAEMLKTMTEAEVLAIELNTHTHLQMDLEERAKTEHERGLGNDMSQAA